MIIFCFQGLAHIAFMHVIGSSLCFWVSAIVRETVLGLAIYAGSVYGNYDNGETDYSTATVTNATVERQDGLSDSLQSRFLDIQGLYNPNCSSSAALNTIYENFSPYLYPFSVEFNILIGMISYKTILFIASIKIQ